MVKFTRERAADWPSMKRVLHLAWTRVRDLRRDRSGTVAVVAAISFPIVVGGIGLGAESGFWYLSQRKLQHAADVSAHAAGVRLLAGDSKAQIDAAARTVALASGLSGTVGSIVVNSPPLGGSRAGQVGGVEVILTELRPRLFSSVFSNHPVTISGRAVATTGGGSGGCILALSPTAGGAVTVTGSTVVNLTNCDIASDSNVANSFLMSGSGAHLTVGCVYAVGGAVTTANLTLTVCNAVRTHSAVVPDPYASVAQPLAVGPCQNNKVGRPGEETTVTPTYNHPSGMLSMRFCNGLDVKGIVTFAPGLYIVENGDLTFNGGNSGATSAVTMQGSGVTFYVRAGARVRLAGTVHLALAAPTSGALSGILFFGDRSNAGSSQTVTGDTTSTLQGAIYMPNSEVTFIGNSTVSNGCTQVVGLTVTFTGNSTVRADCTGSGTRPIATRRGVSLVE